MGLITRIRGASRRHTGQAAEDQALAYLHTQGLQLVTRNFTTRQGEVDLIMRHGAALVFVEVRYRDNTQHGTPAETVTARKQARVRLAASRFLQQHPALAECPCRFDVIGLTAGHAGQRATIEWIQDAFA